MLPRGVVFLDSFQYVAREDVQNAFIEVIELLDPAPFHQMAEKMMLGWRYFGVLNISEGASGVIPQGIHVEAQIFGEQFPESFQDAALKFGVVLLVEKIKKVG